MGFDISQVLKEMGQAATDSAGADVPEMKNYVAQILEKQKQSLKDLATMRVNAEIDDDDVKDQLEREKIIIETEFLVVPLMAKAMAQKAVNAAIDVFRAAVNSAIQAL